MFHVAPVDEPNKGGVFPKKGPDSAPDGPEQRRRVNEVAGRHAAWVVGEEEADEKGDERKVSRDEGVEAPEVEDADDLGLALREAFEGFLEQGDREATGRVRGVFSPDTRPEGCETIDTGAVPRRADKKDRPALTVSAGKDGNARGSGAGHTGVASGRDSHPELRWSVAPPKSRQAR